MNNQYQQVYVWSRYLRLFHWINVLAITILLGLGLIIFNAKTLGVSVDGKILLKTLHVITGYVFAINLLLRLVMGFFGKGYERWKKTLPFTKGFSQELAEFKQQPHKKYKGHNPLGKLMVGALLLSMCIQMISGLIIAGTDIYYPPFGQYFAKSIAIDSSKLDLIEPYSKENVDDQAYLEMRDIRKPFITAHVYAFYTLLFLIPLHIVGVIVAERREKTALVSAMINGYKYIPKKDNRDD
ncbi:cytochrome b/b6 domain-containing protein [Aliiglaciecola sp. 3_MG-2023]|uniref:cytochrome b/b6 domain-containing protein n=1 Tax=Aliiglaciecola sp. 3_MG-2023 TaxID=3062644 RepID=UPI0026E198A6|nr:cytochrome b/b6 domain-containing protein [Aliiglaciecola sp. 3_MG-2023]MDO6695646.1 cytochrome b/b6 domain-containing protein [Aliiglaciecola sp. 3_MG-2023]